MKIELDKGKILNNLNHYKNIVQDNLNRKFTI